MASRRLGLTAALTVGPIAAWRFAQAYRARAGYPHRHPPEDEPSALGLAFENLRIPSAGVELPAWWIPARDGQPGPAVLLVHGWESARDRTLPNAQILNALGIHVLTLDIRGHGENPPEELPLTAGEFGADALAGARALLDRADVTSVGILGHSMGGIGALWRRRPSHESPRWSRLPHPPTRIASRDRPSGSPACPFPVPSPIPSPG